MHPNRILLILCLGLLFTLCSCSNSYLILISLNDNAKGLRKGSEVMYTGKKIGEVKEVIKENNTNTVKIMVNDNIKIPEGSSFNIKIYNIVGQKQIEIIPSKSSKFILPGTTVKGKNVSKIKI